MACRVLKVLGGIFFRGEKKIVKAEFLREEMIQSSDCLPFKPSSAPAAAPPEK
ncbi:MAG: hypothetical protein ACI81P_003585 [Neolewinella sp.]|jgi:hypothetical protein